MQLQLHFPWQVCRFAFLMHARECCRFLHLPLEPAASVWQYYMKQACQREGGSPLWASQSWITQADLSRCQNISRAKAARCIIKKRISSAEARDRKTTCMTKTSDAASQRLLSSEDKLSKHFQGDRRNESSITAC